MDYNAEMPVPETVEKLTAANLAVEVTAVNVPSVTFLAEPVTELQRLPALRVVFHDSEHWGLSI